jgi:hypothetical protein
MRFKLVKNEEEWERLRDESIFLYGITSLTDKDFNHAFDSVDINDVIIVIDHES